MANIDLDARLKARTEKTTSVDPPTLTIGGTTYPLPPKLSVAVLDHAGMLADVVAKQEAGEEIDPVAAFAVFNDTIRSLLGKELGDELLKNWDLDIEDLGWVLEEALIAYGYSMGKSSASDGS